MKGYPYTYFILYTEDGGETWTEQTLPDNYRGIPAQANCVFFINDTVGWIGTSGSGFGGSIYITKDGGANWKKQQDFEQEIFDIQMLSIDTGWAVGGDFVYHTTNGSFVTSVIEHHLAKESLRIIPNPVSNTFRIETNIAFSYENCQLEITNITGNPILRLNSVSFEAITSESIDLANYPAGIYFVTIRYESNNQINCFNQKVIKL
ncbi:MAG: T9SS type A sorting domain-containing protein [Bacteroidales bacterium]|nr:T9SS type A sorting domain-containing protein [Bacteroidales bacterium]